MHNGEIKIVAGSAELYAEGASEFLRCARASIAANGRFSVALSGGSTPKGVYSLLAATNDVPWDRVHFFFGDERHVPPTDAESNYRMVHESLFAKANIPAENIHRVRAELDAETAAAQYEEELRSFFQVAEGEWPRFDLVMLGMGPDGHTASLFPGSQALHENARMVVANWVEKFKTHRITLTFPVLNHASEVMFLVAGEDKAGVLREVLQGQQKLYPAQQVQPVDGSLLWIIEKSAARLLMM